MSKSKKPPVPVSVAIVGTGEDMAESWQPERGAILQPGVFERIMVFTAMLTVPPYRGREWAQRQAREALGHGN